MLYDLRRILKELRSDRCPRVFGRSRATKSIKMSGIVLRSLRPRVVAQLLRTRSNSRVRVPRAASFNLRRSSAENRNVMRDSFIYVSDIYQICLTTRDHVPRTAVTGLRERRFVRSKERRCYSGLVLAPNFSNRRTAHVLDRGPSTGQSLRQHVAS